MGLCLGSPACLFSLVASKGSYTQSPTEHARAAERNSRQGATADRNHDHNALSPLCTDRGVEKWGTNYHRIVSACIYIGGHYFLFPLHLHLGKALQPK